MAPKFYKIGGCVRDKILNLPCKDIDFSVEADSFEDMRAAIIARGCDIKVEKSEYLTIRAVDPVLGGVDFVMCRRDGIYTDGRRPDSVTPGTLLDDQKRRDLTINSIAEDDDGNLIDPFNGMKDLERRMIRCVGVAEHRIAEDSLRILRIIRFSITKGFDMVPSLENFLLQPTTADLLGAIAIERIRDELFKCFAFDTMETLRTLEKFWRIRNHIFERNLSLVPTIAAK